MRKNVKPTIFACDNCGGEYVAAQLNPVADLWERVSPGDTMPDGECPECGALCFVTETPEDKRIAELKVKIVWLKAALKAALDLINKGER